MSTERQFAKTYGVFTFLVEAAKSGCFGTLDDVRRAPLVEVLNFCAYQRTEQDLIQARQKKQ